MSATLYAPKEETVLAERMYHVFYYCIRSPFVADWTQVEEGSCIPYLLASAGGKVSCEDSEWLDGLGRRVPSPSLRIEAPCG